MSKSGKGSAFEREVCQDLSRWWSQDFDEPRDDIFWRSSNSGGRATVRGRRGKSTFGHCGDIAAVDPIGQPLLDFVTIEVKRGYSSETLASLLDCGRKAAQQQWESWIQQAIEASERAKSFSWMIVAKRDQRERIVAFDKSAFDAIRSCFRNADREIVVRPFFALTLKVRFKDKQNGKRSSRIVQLVAMSWEDWIDCVHPNHVKRNQS